jgi:hypothetical protein
MCCDFCDDAAIQAHFNISRYNNLAQRANKEQGYIHTLTRKAAITLVTFIRLLVIVSSHVSPIRVHIIDLHTADLTLVLRLVAVMLVLDMNIQTLLAVTTE